MNIKNVHLLSYTLILAFAEQSVLCMQEKIVVKFDPKQSIKRDTPEKAETKWLVMATDMKEVRNKSNAEIVQFLTKIQNKMKPNGIQHNALATVIAQYSDIPIQPEPIITTIAIPPADKPIPEDIPLTRPPNWGIVPIYSTSSKMQIRARFEGIIARNHFNNEQAIEFLQNQQNTALRGSSQYEAAAELLSNYTAPLMPLTLLPTHPISWLWGTQKLEEIQRAAQEPQPTSNMPFWDLPRPQILWKSPT